MVRDGDATAPPPFSGLLEPATFYTGPAQDEALARLEWLVAERQRCGLVVAAAGLGKSHLAVTAARRLGGLAAEVAVLSLAGLADGEWLELLLDRLPLDAASRAEPVRPWLKLENRRRENTLMGRPTVLVVDDIDRGPSDARDGVARLVSAAEPRFGTTAIVAIARPEGLPLVPDAIRRRAAVRIDLPAWTAEDVAGYLACDLARSGRPEGIFSPAAAATICRFAGGVPEVIRRLAHLALAAADAEGLELVEPAMVEQVWRELSPPEDSAAGAGSDPDDAVTQPRFKAVRRLWG
ncbi:MAG: hypothetical protein ACKOCX_04985 [Planctomycetota bacterium]